jgi:hypothetical protein
MDFFKKHYEKVVLSVVLLVVAVAAFWLTQKVSEVRQTLDEQLKQQVGGKKKSLKPVDLTNDLSALKQLESAPKLSVESDYNLFNPIRWVRAANGTLIPDPRKDPTAALKLVSTSPLNFSIVYVGPVPGSDPIRFQFNVIREHDKKAANRRPLTTTLAEGTKNDFFHLRELHGPKDNPGEVVVELVGGEKVVLVRDKPYAKTMAFQGDLRLDAKDFLGKRADDTLTLGGVVYKIVAISKDELVVSAPNGTRTTVRLSPAQ